MGVLIDLKNKVQTEKGKILTNTGFLFFRCRAFSFQDSSVRVFSLVTEKHARVSVFILIRMLNISGIPDIRDHENCSR